MKTQLENMGVQVLFTCSEKEARILNHVASYLRAKGWSEHYSQHFSSDHRIDADAFDSVMIHLHMETGRALNAISESRSALAGTLKNG
jgi:hypothetical protein